MIHYWQNLFAPTQTSGRGTGGALSIGVLLLVLAGPSAQAGEARAFVVNHANSAVEWGACPAFMPDSCGLAVLQGNPKENNTDVLFRLRSETTAPQHWHTSAERMVLLAGQMMVDYEGQEPVVVESGEYAYGPPELPHLATCQSQEDCVLFISFDQTIDAFAVDQ